MGKKIYVGNLSYSATEGTLSELFAQFGTVDSCRIITDRDSGRSKGFGFVEMSNDEEAERAIADLNSHELDGRKLTVNEARPQAPRSNGFSRGGSGGGFGRDRRSFSDSRENSRNRFH